MGIRTRIDLKRREVDILLRTGLTPKEMSLAHAEFHEDVRAEALAKARQVLGTQPPYLDFVDGRETRDLRSVKPVGGEIVTELSLSREMFLAIRDLLRKNSPVGRADDPRPGHPGMYRESHMFTADLDFIDLDGDVIPPARSYQFTSTVPYARKIERWGLGLAEGVYHGVATLASKRFGNIADISFSYRSPGIGAINEWASRTKMESPYRRGDQRDEWLRRQPAIVIVLR